MRISDSYAGGNAQYRYFEQVYGAKATIVLLYTDNGIVVIGSIDSDSHIFLIFLVVWKKIVEKESFDVSIIIVFSVFPVSQLLMITAINEQVFRNMTLYTGWILAAAILGSVADGVLLYTLLRQQQLQELKLRLSEVQSTWEIDRESLS